MKTREIVLGMILICALILALYYAQLSAEQATAPGTKKKKAAKPKLVRIEREEEEEEEEESDEQEEEEEKE